MDPRIDNHEQRIKQLEEAVASFRLELKDSVNTMIKWTVGTVAGAAVAGIAVITFVLNHALPKPDAAEKVAAPQPPIIITIPVPVALPPANRAR